MHNPIGERATQLINILIVDDDPELCTLVEMLFRGQGYATQVAYNGREAIRCVESGTPDAVVLDVMMPDLDGWDTFKRMRSSSDIPVLFLTALASGEAAARALKMGANDFMSKPFHPAELLARVEMLIASTRRESHPVHPTITSFQRPTVSVMIPTLNEAENLPLVLPYLPMDWIYEVLLVDGLSTDNTVAVARELMPSIKVVMETQPGKGAALRAGYRKSTGDIIIVMDADGSNDPREFPRFITALIEGSDFVKGSRFAHGSGTTDMPRLRQYGNRFFVFLVNLLFNVRFTDLCYGYHAFWRYCLDLLDLDDVDGFEIDTAIYVRALCQRFRVTEVPSFEGYRFRGVGKLRTFPDGWRVLSTIIREAVRHLRSPARMTREGFRGQRPRGVPLLTNPNVKAEEIRKISNKANFTNE